MMDTEQERHEKLENSCRWLVGTTSVLVGLINGWKWGVGTFCVWLALAAIGGIIKHIDD